MEYYIPKSLNITSAIFSNILSGEHLAVFVGAVYNGHSFIRGGKVEILPAHPLLQRKKLRVCLSSLRDSLCRRRYVRLSGGLR